MVGRWKNQDEAYQMSMSKPAIMLDMDMGTGKTRVAIDVIMDRPDVKRVLVVCPKTVVPVWRVNLTKFRGNEDWVCWDETHGTIKKKCDTLKLWYDHHMQCPKQIVVINYDIVWREPLGDFFYKRCNFDMVILDESHRAKSAGSKVSKYLAMLGKTTKYRMCLSGTPMANSPLDIYGQYRFLDPSVFGTRHDVFLQEYAILGGPERRFVVGYKNQQRLNDKFKSLAYTCKMSDIADRIKLPPSLPDVVINTPIPAADMRTIRELAKEFIAECSNGGTVVLNNALTRVLRMQQITSGFCVVQDGPGCRASKQTLNATKKDALQSILQDIDPNERVVVFCKFTHDLDCVYEATNNVGRIGYELSGRKNELERWKLERGSVLAVQIQAGAEGVDMTASNYAIYYSLPYSLALYDQSRARLYRPGQTRPVSFSFLLAPDTIDVTIYDSLCRKKDLIQSIKDGTVDYGHLKGT